MSRPVVPSSCSFRHGPHADPDGSVTWRVWSARSQKVELCLTTDAGKQFLPMRPTEQGWFEVRSPHGADGQRYGFRLDGDRELPDPASRWQPDGVHAPSALFRPAEFKWSDQGWSGVPLSQIVFYELHIGTFTPEGTLDAIIPRLAQLVELGVTAIELLPVAQFPGSRGWGYDGVYLYAVQNSYGGPRALQRFVDAAHAHGLAVFMDVVYNHLGPDGNYLGAYSDYFTEKYHTPWGQSLNYDDAGSDHVRRFVTDNARMWLEDFHMDGLRLDAIHAILDFGPTHILREIQRVAADVAAEESRAIHVIAESNLNDIRLVSPPSDGGFGLAGQWSDDFHHAVHVLLTGEHDGYYEDFHNPDQLVKAINDVFVYDGCYSPHRQRRHGAPRGERPREQFVVSIQNHDQVGNRALGDRFGTLLKPEQQRLAAGLMLLSPTTPLLFMGEEYGEQHPFPFFCDFESPELKQAVRDGRKKEFEDFHWKVELPDPLSKATFRSAILAWNWEAQPWQAGLRRWYQDLLRMRSTQLTAPDVSCRNATWYPAGSSTDSLDGVLELLRSDDVFPGAPRLAAYFNISSQAADIPQKGLIVRDQLPWYSVVSSEESRYAGRRDPAPPRDLTHATLPQLMPYEVLIFGLVEGDA